MKDLYLTYPGKRLMYRYADDIDFRSGDVRVGLILGLVTSLFIIGSIFSTFCWLLAFYLLALITFYLLILTS